MLQRAQELLVAAYPAQFNGSKQHVDSLWFKIPEGSQAGRTEQEL